MAHDPARPPRFPCVAALLCAACLGAAVWMWMRYSWTWEVDLDDLENSPRLHEGAFARVRGVLGKAKSFRKTYHRFVISAEEDKRVWVYLPRGVVRDDEGASVSIEGRLTLENLRGMYGLGIDGPVLDPNASRFHGATIAGLVVGVMGVFVFAVALRHWLAERKAFREAVPGT